MCNIVLDTNIIISAMLSPNGNPAKIIKMLRNNDEINLYYSLDIFAEYQRILSYERLNISQKIQFDILREIQDIGIPISPKTSSIPLPEHYPNEPFIMTPADYWRELVIKYGNE